MEQVSKDEKVQCNQCGHLLKELQKFCPHCGSQILLCQNCHTPYQATDNFCSNCGFNFHAQNDIKIVTTYGSSEELKHVSILFADIKGSTAQVEHLDAEEAYHLLKPISQTMIDTIYAHDGTVIHVAGDGIVALFGAPKTLEDHALRACFSALTMQRKIESLYPNILIRVGINSGEIILDILGSKDHQEYEASGPAVHLAARLEQSAQPGHIQISQSTFSLVEKYVIANPLAPIHAKGFSAPIIAFDLISVVENKLSLYTQHKITTTPFLGRESEILQLKNLLVKAEAGQGTSASISGEAGLGKSRLVYELTQSSKSNFNIIVCGGAAYNKTPLFPIFDLFAQILQLKMHSSATLTEQDLKKITTEFALKQDYASNAISTLLNLTVDDPDWNKLHPELKRKFTFEIGMDLLLKSSHKKPLCIVVEDMHWIDAETKVFIEQLILQLSSTLKFPLFLLMTYRPNYIDLWRNLPNYHYLELHPIDSASLQKISDSLLGSDIKLESIKGKLLERSGGNPFFLEEMIKSLISEKVLIGQPGAYSIDTVRLEAYGRLPETIYAVILAQIDHLEPDEKNILEKLSVLGQKFSYNLAKAFLEIDANILRSILNLLQEKQFIYESSIYPETIFTFKHALIQEATYNSLLKSERKILHTQVVHTLEKNYSNQINEFVEMLAEHSLKGEQWEKAFEYNFQAAKKAFLYTAHQESINFYELALVAAKNLNETDELILKQIHVYLELFHSSFRLGLLDKQQQYIDKALKLENKIHDNKIKAIIQAAQIGIWLELGETSKIKNLIVNLHQHVLQLGDIESLISVDSFLLQTYLITGEYKKAIDAAQFVISKIPERDYLTQFIRVKYWYVTHMFMLMAYAEIGDFLEIKKYEQLLAPLLETNHPNVEQFCISLGLGIGYLRQNNFVKAKDYLTAALQYSIDFKIINYTPIAAAALGCLELWQGNINGLEYIRVAIKEGKAIQFSHLTASSLPWIIEGLILGNEHELAQQMLNEGMKIVKIRDLQGLRAHLLRLFAQLAMQESAPNVNEIKKLLNQSLELSKQLEMLPNQLLVEQLLSTLK